MSGSDELHQLWVVEISLAVYNIKIHANVSYVQA